MKKEAISGIILALFIITFSFTILTTESNLAQKLVKKHSTAENAAENTEQLFKYFESKAELPAIFNEREKSHLQDVKKIIILTKILFVILLALTVTGLIFTEKPKMLINGGIGAIILLLLAAIFRFETAFTTMHSLLFEQGTWTFPATSTLIKHYPTSFFNEYYTIAGILISIFSLLCILAGALMKRKIYFRKRKNLKKR